MGLGPSGIAAVMLVTALAGGLSAMFYGHAMRYLSVHRAFLVGFGLAAAGMLIIGSTRNLTTVAIGFVTYSLGNAWFTPNLMNSRAAG